MNGRTTFVVDETHPSETGQGIVEYGLILVIMVVACVVAIVFFGDQLGAILGFIASKV